MTTKAIAAKAATGPTTEELQTRIADLTDVNDQLLAVIDGLRDIHETLLTTFAAHGYTPAAKALLQLRLTRSRIAKEAH